MANFLETMGLIHLAQGGTGGSSKDLRYVTFVNAETGETFKKPVAVGDDCADVVKRGLWPKPTKESTDQHDFTFSGGWAAEPDDPVDDNILKNITEDKTVYAIFTATARKYTITWCDDDGSVLNTEQWAYGSTPSYTPNKTGHAFTGWTPTPAPVTGDASYTANWVESIASGDYYGAKWNLSGDYVLTISGSGAMPVGSNASSYPWYAYRNDVREIVIEEGITTVAPWAFDSFSKVTKVTLPSTLTTIYQRVFSNLTSLTSITIPDGVTLFGANVFMGSTKLASITLPDSLTDLGTSVCDGCTGLTSINIPKGVSLIPTNAFRNCTSLTSITIPANVTTINNAAFWSCSGLTSATFEVTSGWTVYSSASATTGTSLTSSNLSKPATAATYLKNTYSSMWWKRA